MNDDSSLREQFAALRRSDAERTPSFERVLARTRRQSPRLVGGLALAASAVIAAVAVSLFWFPRHPGSHSAETDTPMLADWRAPTDFLLDTPGRALLTTIPDLGHSAAPLLDPFPPIGMITAGPHTGREHS
jgi:hypothetical protein